MKGDTQLQGSAAPQKSILRWRSMGCDSYVYFDNDQKSAAPMDAFALRRHLRISCAALRPPNTQRTPLQNATRVNWI
jgi:uncharacterized protein YecE (DUF72 family)